MRRIESRINTFLELRTRPFTINDIFNEVRWDGSRKHLARFLTKHPRITTLGKKREAGKKLTIYDKVDSTTAALGLYGGD